jgi:hypothetical protein
MTPGHPENGDNVEALTLDGRLVVAKPRSAQTDGHDVVG